jgi:hypothetical protein
MRPYAELPGRLARQLLADVLALGWLAGFGWLAYQARELVLRLRRPASGLVDAGSAVGDAFAGAAGTAARVPLIGEQLAGALRAGESAGRSLTGSGHQQLELLGTVAAWIAVLIAVIGVLPPLTLWMPPRLHYARAAGAAVACRESDADLLALRALTRVPVRRLRTVADDPAVAWRRADPEVLRRLAALELRRLGLRSR